MKKRTKIFVALIMLSIVPLLSLFPAEETNSGRKFVKPSNGNGFAVVELFTSEGCSSCPPAEELLAEIQKETTGEDIYLLAYHVDYWDRLGWKDKFSNAAFTARQQQYADWLKLQTIYTPQFVINGKSEFAGASQNQLYNLVSDALLENPSSSLQITAQENKKSLEILYKTNSSSKTAKLYVALVQKKAITNVERGENKGRQLTHVQIVNQITSIFLDKTEGKVVIPKPENVTAADLEMIAFIQDNNTGVISAATKTPIK